MRKIDYHNFIRFKSLLQEYISEERIFDITGANVAEKSEISQLVYSNEKAKIKDISGNWLISRYAVENFLQQRELISIVNAAYQTGMTTESFRNALNKIEIDVKPDQTVIDESILRKLQRMSTNGSSGLTIFNNHTEYCNHLHNFLIKRFAINITPVFCEVSQLIDKSPDFSYYRCAVTHAPVSLRYAIPINTNKPLRLAPDFISLNTFLSNEELYLPFSFLSKTSFMNDIRRLEKLNFYKNTNFKS